MGIINHVQLLERLHSFILHKSTGTPKQLAKKLNISVRSLYRIIEELRGHGVIITFDTARSSYIYENEVEFKLLLQIYDPGIE